MILLRFRHKLWKVCGRIPTEELHKLRVRVEEEISSDLAFLPFGLIFVDLFFLLLGEQRVRLRSVREKHIVSHVQISLNTKHDLRPSDREDDGRLIQFPTFSQITD